jgi:uncharacterized Fe-S cluster-containing radical SAM superfamily protein
MMQGIPFDPVRRAADVEAMVMHRGKRMYYRFRASRHYGGIVTADAVGCSFLCAYCWNYKKNECPERSGQFYAADEVVERLAAIARKRAITLFRVSGAEPVLGPASFCHLLDVLGTGRFIIETNGLVLGYHPELIDRLNGRDIAVRVSVKGWDERSFEQLSGARSEFFEYPLVAIRRMIASGIDAWPAVMGDLFGVGGIRRLTERMGSMGIRTRIETEYLERYPFVIENLKRRGWEGNFSERTE